MPTTSAARELPNAFGPLAFAIASVFALAMSMSGTGNDALDIVVVIAALPGVVLSTRYTVRTYRKISEHDFQLAHVPRWLMTALALLLNGLTCFVVAGYAIVILGVLLTGKGMVG